MAIALFYIDPPCITVLVSNFLRPTCTITSDSPSSGDGARWPQEITDDNGNTWWVDVEQRDGHVYRVDTGEMLW